MRTFPGSEGPMATWPRVEAVPGIEAALQALVSRFKLILATNASESNAGDIRAALHRVGLESLFGAIVTPRQAGAPKPDPDFFRAVVDAAGCGPSQVVMVGDDYEVDVSGARQAGLMAIWFNAAGVSCPVSQGVHDLEIRHMQDLPAAIDRLVTSHT